MIRPSVVALVAFVAAQKAVAFAPASRNAVSVPSTQLHAESRRDALGQMGIALGGLLVGGFAAPQESSAGLDNPALQTFKGRKKTKGSFIPGKGMRDHESFDTLVAGLDNPALQTFKGRKKTKGSFIPGKGMREKESFDTLVAGLENPALQTFKGGKKTKGAFIPGKGLRKSDHDVFDVLMG